MATQFLINRDIAGYPTTGERTSLRFSDTVQRVTLTASTVETITVPSAALIGSPGVAQFIAYFTFASGEDVWVLNAASPTLTAPTGTVDTVRAVLNPKAKQVSGGSTLQLLSAGTDVEVCIEYYLISNA